MSHSQDHTDNPGMPPRKPLLSQKPPQAIVDDTPSLNAKAPLAPVEDRIWMERGGHPDVGLPPMGPISPAVLVERTTEPSSFEVSQIKMEQVSFRSPTLFRNMFFQAFSLLLLLFFLVWIVEKLKVFVLLLSGLPTLLSYPAFGVVVLLTGLVFYSVGKTALAFFRFQYRPQMDFTQIRMNEKDSVKVYAKVKAGLEHYLESVYRDWDLYAVNLGKSGVKESEIHERKKAVERLLSPRALDACSWANDYQRSFQAYQDQWAKERITHYSRIVGVKTAICPWPFLDMIAVFYNSFRLCRELSMIAHRRSDGWATVTILLHVIGNTYIASEAQDAAVGLADLTRQPDMDLDAGMEVATGISGLVGDAAKKVFSFALPKVGEGVANTVFTYRLGKRTWRRLSPFIVSKC